MDKYYDLKEPNLINVVYNSDENVEFLTSVEARSLQIKAKLAGKKLDIQHGYDGTLWCYKHEYLNINNKK